MKSESIKLKNSPSSPRRVSRGRRATKASQKPSLALKRILVPLDFSGRSRQALAAAVPLAQRHGGRISLIHVVEPAFVGGEMGLAYLPMGTSEVVSKAKARLRDTAAKLIPPELLDQILVRQGSAYYQITETARRLKADMIVIASQGHTGLSRLLLGNIAERVVRHASCPVLVVRRRG